MKKKGENGMMNKTADFSIIVQVLNKTIYLHDAEKPSMQKPCNF